MADLNIAYMRQNKMGAYRGTVPMAFFNSATGNMVSATVLDCATSKQTAVAPDLDGDGVVIARLLAVGGDVHIAIGANPTAVAAAAQTIRLVAGNPEYFTVHAGERIAAINA